MVLFFEHSRQLLDNRLKQVRDGIEPKKRDYRNFFYHCRTTFLQLHPKLTEIDSKSKSVYSDWEGGVLYRYFVDHCEEFDIPREFYWRVGELMKLTPEAKAVCEGEGEKFMIDKDTRNRVGKNCSFALICEKRTVSEELLKELRKRGYRIHLISTGGQVTGDTHEALVEAIKDMDPENPTFYVLVLHDYDLDGVIIYYNLRDRIPGTIDVGINRDFFKQLPKLEWRIVEERRLNKKEHRKLKDRIEQDGKEIYSLEDYEYLQGKPFIVSTKKGDKTHFNAKRVEIDAIHTAYGIKPFVDYIEKRIKEECKCWDLTKIGVEEFVLTEPENPFEEVLRERIEELSETYHNKKRDLESPIDRVKSIVKKSTETAMKPFKELVEKVGLCRTSYFEVWDPVKEFGLTVKKKTELVGEFEEGFDREYVPDFEDELKELNEKVHCYCGDITTAEGDIQIEFDELQEEVDDAAGDDEELPEFKDKLAETEFGEEELKELEIPDEKEVLDVVISALQERRKKLEESE